MAAASKHSFDNASDGNQHDARSSRRRSVPADETAESQSRFKRQRTALACNSCRTRKSRCDGSRPKCTMCVEMGLECVYQQPAGAGGKGSQPIGFENRLNSIEETLRQLVEENRRVQERQLPPATPVSQSSQNALHVGLEANREDPDGAVSSQGGSQVHAPAEDTVDGMGAITFADEQESGFFGPSSNIAFIGQISHAMAKAVNGDSSSRSTDPRFDSAIMSLSRPASPIGAPQNLGQTVSNAVDVYTLPPENEMLHLIRLFFSDTGMLFPYIHEGALLETFAIAKHNNFTSVRRSWLTLLNMILAFATCVSARPDLPVERSAAESDIFFRRAQALSGKMAFRTANLEIVQYLLLMTQYLQGTQRSAQTWNLHGLTVKAAFQLGLHTTTASSRFTPLENEIRRRTWFGCVVLDRTLSMTFGRPPAIPTEYVVIDLPANIDLDILSSSIANILPPETSSSPSTVSFFVATIKLYHILGEIISKLYGYNLGFNVQHRPADTLEHIVRLERQLLNWKHDLPPMLRLRPWEASFAESEQSPVFDRLSIIIALRYLNTRVLLHRQILSRFLDQISSSSSSSSGSDMFLQNEDALLLRQFGQSSLQACVDSASEIISIIHKVGKRPYLLGAWWFSTYYTFNAALVVFASLLISVNNAAWASASASLPAPMTRLSQSPDELRTSLHLAVDALQNLGGGVRLVERCRKYLQALVQVSNTQPPLPYTTTAATTTTALNNDNNNNNTITNINQQQHQQQQQQPVDFVGIPTSFHPDNTDKGDKDSSPLGLDLGEFLTEENLDFLTGLIGTNQSMFDMPIQGY